MRPFCYARPNDLSDALSLLAEHGPDARVLAGGTDVLVRLRLGHMRPGIVVDVKHIGELRSDIVETDGRLRIGARAVMTDIIAERRIRRHFPALVEAAAVVGSVQIRNRATLAGNICNASPAADTAPVLLAHGATVNLIASSGRRHVPLHEFFIGPGRTALGPGELVESIDLPLTSDKTGAAFGRVTRRRGVDLATINLCCLVTESGRVRFAFGAVGPRPFVVEDDLSAVASAEADTGALVGASGRASQDAALDRLLAYATPISDLRASQDYRMAMLSVMSRRALDRATGRLRQTQ
jgi:CO/xanthine dehydrogenase FAD-binding subunit